MNIKIGFNAICGFILHKTKYNKYKDSWLIGGHGGELYQDNSKAFYEFILEEKENINIYWISNNENIDIPGNIIKKGSIENYIAYFNSKTNIFSHSISSDIAPFCPILPLYKKKKKIFISHGVEGFKKKSTVKKGFSKLKEQILKSYDLQFVVGEREKQIKIREWGIDQAKVAITGLARHDYLYNHKDDSVEKKILFMPTWRPWVSEKNLKESEYYKNIVGILNDQEFLDLVEKNKFKVNVYIHQLMRKSFNDFNINNDLIKILDENTNLQLEILNSKFLITDYSSVSWDFIFMNKNVIFYMFDKKKYLENIGSYLSLDNNEFGEYHENKQTCIKAIERKINGQVYGEKTNYFSYFDNNNNNRIFEHIIKL